jgi:hypothetical protein
MATHLPYSVDASGQPAKPVYRKRRPTPLSPKRHRAITTTCCKPACGVRVREPLRLKSTLVRVPCNMVPHYARIEDLGPGDYVSVFQCTACGPWRAVVSRKLRVRGPPLPPYSSWAKPEALDLVHVLPLSAVNRLFRRADLIVKFDPTPVNCRRQRVKSGSGSLLSSEPI